MGNLWVAGAQDDVGAFIFVQFCLHGRLDVDGVEDTKPLVCQNGSGLVNDGVKTSVV